MYVENVSAIGKTFLDTTELKTTLSRLQYHINDIQISGNINLYFAMRVRKTASKFQVTFTVCNYAVYKAHE